MLSRAICRGSSLRAEEESDDPSVERNEDKQRDYSRYGDEDKAYPVALSDPVRPAGTDVLRRVWAHRVADRSQRNVNEAIDANGRGVACKDLRPESVYDALHQHHAEGYRGLLDHGWYGDSRHGAEQAGGEWRSDPPFHALQHS